MRRMLGMSEWGVVQIVLAQALTYVIPGWIFGLALAQLLLTFIFNVMVTVISSMYVSDDESDSLFLLLSSFNNNEE